MEMRLLAMRMSLVVCMLSPLLSPSPADWQAALLVIVGVVVALLLLALVAAWLGVRFAAIADRVVVYGVLAALLLTFYVGASLFFTSVMPIKTSYAYEAEAALMALFIAVTYAPASKMVQRLVDTALFRDYYDYGGTLQTFSQKLATAFDDEAVVQTLLDGLMDTLNLRGIAFVPLPEGLEPQVLQVIGPDDLRARGTYATLEGRTMLLGQLARYTLGSHLLPPSTQMVRRPFKGCAALLYIGFGQQSGVSAILLVGHKAAGGPLRREDTALLQTIAHQAATALSNAQLVNGLRISLQQVQVSTSQLVAARTEQELLLHELVSADERQRASLARELHDDALQEVLFVIRHSQLAVRLADAFERSVETLPADADRSGTPNDSVSQLAPTSARLRRELSELAERSSVVEKKLRALCLGLYPDMLHRLGLTAALDDLAEQMNTSLTVVTIEYDDEAARIGENLDPQVALHLYRIAQEGLSNAHKHGRASAATVKLEVVEAPTEVTRWHDRWSWIRLQVRDNGIGIPLPVDIGASLRDGHLGLASMRERAQLIGGRLHFDKAPEGGAQITVIAPVARILRTIPLSSVRS